MRHRSKDILFRKPLHGFTLVELLVVISIIALLVSILMPALGRAKSQALLVSCSANLKQIGTLVQVYLTDNDDKPPILTTLGAYTSIPVEYTSLSVALRNYTGAKGSLPATMDISIPWDVETMNDYAAKYMPAYFQCPLIRGKGLQADTTGSVVLGGQQFQISEHRGGGRESYGYSIFGDLYKGRIMYPNHPLGPPNGVLKYALLTWYDPQSASAGAIMSSSNWPTAKERIRPNNWTNAARQLRAGLSESVILACRQGEWSPFDRSWIVNYNKHAKGKQGGSPVLMGDTHVSWVPGTQIGWF